MLFKPFPGTRKAIDLLTLVAPIFRIDLSRNEACLIGTGFWVTDAGHLVTAWHVVQENIDANGIDRGPIFALQTSPKGAVIVRNFVKSDCHPKFDLALSETQASPPETSLRTMPVAMSLDRFKVDEPVFSFAVQDGDQALIEETIPGDSPYHFEGAIFIKELSSEPISLKFSIRLSFGRVEEIFEEMRDSVILPFPCIQTNIPIYGGNSGGPVLDVRGRIRAVNCTSYEGRDIAFHVPIEGVLELQTRAQSLRFNSAGRRYVSVLELAAKNMILMDPPVLDLDSKLKSVLRWFWYLIQCLLRRDRPSRQVHVASKHPQFSRPEGWADGAQ